MSDNAILKNTGQYWKIHLLFIGVMVGGVFMFLGLFVFDRNILGILSVVGGLAIGTVSFGFVIMSISCPKCGVHWAWLSVRQKSLNEWLLWLIQLDKCPNCLYPEEK